MKPFEVSRTDPSGETLFPLSAAQRATWFAQQFDPEVPILIAHYVELRGELDVELLDRETRAVAYEFQSPLLKVIEIDGHPMQYVDEKAEISVGLVDFRGSPDPIEDALGWMRRDCRTQLDLAVDGIVATAVLRVGDAHYLWYSRIHHVALDGFGAMTMMNRIAHRYSASAARKDSQPSRAATLRTLYDIDERYRMSDRFAADREYWAERNTTLAGSSLAEASGPAQTESRLESTLISDRSCALLYESENHAAPVIAALALYLARMTAKETVQIHVPMSGRTTAVLRDSGGMMVNVTPLLIRVAAVDTVGELFAQVQHELMGALRHQRCSLDDIRRDAGVTSGLEGEDSYAGPMVNVMLFRQEVQLGEVVGEYHIITSGPVEDLLVNVYPSGDRLRVDFRANPIRYEEAGLREHHRNFVGLLEELIASDSGAELADIHGPTAREGERRQREVRHLEYWRHELAGAPELLQLPFDRPRPATQSLDSAQVEVLIAADTHARITAMASDLGTDTRAVLHASFALLVSRLSGASDVVIGTPAGSDANIVAIRSRVDLVTTFTALLYSVVEVHSNARAHSEIRLEQLVQPLHVEDVPAYAPVVQVTFESVTGADEHPRDIGRFDLGVSAVETFDEVGTPSGISVRLAFATDLFDAETVRGLGLRFARVLESVTADPAIMVGDIDILSDVERSAIRPVRSDPRASHRTLADLFDGAARTHPDGVALSYLDAELTYRELDERSSKLARELIDRGIGPENIVALGMTRSIESVVAMLAVSKAGAAFVPVDPTYPDERVRFMLTDSGAVLGLTVVAELHRLPDSVPWSAIDDAEFRGRLARLSVRSISDVDRVHPIRPDNPAYVIYTSGSTGLPKGVTVSHRGLEALAAEQRSRFGATQDARTLHFSTPSFDASIFEYLLAFGAGATMVIAPSTIYGGDELSHFLESQRVTHGFVTTAALGTVSPEGLSDFGEVVVGGEACPPDLVQRWAPGRRLCNAYGPTETTVMSNIGEPMVSSEDITVGGPLRGFEEIVLDQRLHPVPDGVVGELYISGDALARGYHRKYALTAERFVADPFGLPGQRMYRTGDLVRWRRGRGLEYVGRSDFQVKVRGFRIELGEIDSVVRSCPQVENAVTVARAAPSGTAMITTYVVPAGGSALSTAELTRYVASRVPSYMVPAAFVLLDELPVTPAGKVDRAALPAPRLDARSDDFRPPEGAEELVLAEIFADVLGVETVGAGDDFFDLGGNSLIATKLIARVNAAEEIDFGVRTLFEAPTIESLARHVRDAKSSRVDRTRSKRPILQAHSYRDKIPVSVAQRRLWFVNQFDTSSPAYNIPMVVRLSGALDVAAMQRAVGDVVDRHESLRTVYPASVDGPHQVVVPSERVTSKIAWEVSVDEEALDRRIADLAREGFDVSANVPLRGSLFRVTPDDHVLALVVHHISADGASLEPLARDLTRAYAARAAKRAPDWSPLPVQYADYSQWQIELLGSDDDPDTLEAKQLDYWTSTLAGLPDVIDLPLDRPRPAERSMRGESVRFSVPADVHSELLELARNHNTTPFMVMHAVLAVLLARLSASPDIAIGTPVGGRAEQVLDDLVGMFVNTVVLRITVDTAATFEEILSRTREVDLAAFGQAEVPFERVVDAVAPERSSSRSPLFQVLLEFQNTADPHLELPGLGVDVVPVDVGVAKFDLQLSLSEQRGKDGLPMGFDAAFTYASDIFERTTVAEFGERFVRLLRSVVSDPTVPVGDTEILGVPERGLVVGGWDGVGVVVGGLTLVDVLDGRFAGVGGGGLVCGGVVLSWGEFDVRVNRFARLLISLGVGPESRVCVALSRSVELLVAVFAVVRAGGVFVPVDVGAPVERVGFVVGVVDPVVVLSRVGDGGCLPVGVGFVDVGCVDVSGFSGGPVGVGDRLGVLLPEHAVYVMFTSGSTGRPKGVVVSHAGVVNRLLWMQGEFPLGVGDVVLQKTPVSFDVSVWVLFWRLMVGARLVVADPGGHRDPVYLVGVIERWGVSVVHFVPSMLEVFVGELSVVEVVLGGWGLRRVFVWGEGLSSVLAGRFAGVCGAELVNLYGPTEASVDVTFHRVEGVVGVGVPIGRPVWNTRVLVLDSRLRPVPVGVVGELYVGGVQVARGYEGRVDLTVGRFVADPVSGVVGARVYRTGDVVRWGCGGVLEFVGRTDFQVKVRGQRVELGEVEAVLAAQVGVAGAVVVLRSGVGGDFLVGFVVGEVGVVVDEVVVLEGVRRSLPGFMVPSVVVVLGEFPVTVHGKLDRKALPDVNFEPQPLQYVAPRTPVEETVAAIFDDLLGTSTVGVNDDFFALGGNSLSAARLVARVNSVLGERINIRDVFDASTVAALAELAQCRGGEGAKPALRPRGTTTDIPLSPAQERMWFANQFDPESAAYNVACALRLDGTVNLSALHAAFVDVVERHESLRTVFPLTDDGPRQVIMSTSQVVSDLAPILVQGEEELRERCRQIVSDGFDVMQQVAMRATLLRRDDQVHSHVLVIVIHHIAADGFSTVPLARDLMSAYTSRVNGEAPQWAPLGIQYADYALWQRGWLGSESDSRSLISKQLGYWAENLAGAPEVLDIPTDRPRVDVRSLRRGRIRFVFGPKVHAGVVALSRKHNATVFMVVHAALAVLLARLSDEDDVAVGTPIAGRGERELDDLVGMFVNTLVLRTAVDRGATFGDFLDQVRNVDLSAFIHADVPFERVVEIVNPSRSTAYSPLFQVMLEFQDIERPALELPDLQVTDVGVEIDTINFDLQLTVTRNAGAAGEYDGLRAEFGYATDIFDEETVAGFADRLQRILERVITDPQSRIGDIEILDAYESAELVPVRGEISAAVQTLPDLLTAATDMATAQDPGAVALVFEEREVTYLELDAQSNRLARMLIESGVGPESVVALCLPRSIESVLAVWSIAKTGAAFLPVDPGHPAARIEHMLGDSGAGWGITSRAHNAALSGLVPWLVLDDAGFEERLRAYSPSKVTDADRKAPIRIDNPVYLIYTSGSTGTPKGVTVTHRGLSDFALQERETFAATTRSRTLHFASPSFDASVLELVMAVGAGATMVIVRPTVYGGSELAALLERERVTHCFVTPAALTSVDPDGLTTVGCVVTGGEACPPELVARWAPGRKMFNAYGPTEATVVSSISAALAPNDPVTIGTPTRGFSEVVLDSRLRAVPVGVAGELYLAGPALARGYHRRYPLTATQFVADPFGAPGTRIYRTGDRVRWTPDRRLEYLGRTDAQVKVRGFRIELGEVEVALQTHPRVAQAVTAVWNGDGRDRLIGYVVPDRGASVDPRDVLAHAGKRLPSYMVPAAVVVLDALPLTVHGKLDRAALPTPDFSSAATPDRPPRTETENLLAALFAQVLGLDAVGVHDSFFELGGDSIMSIQLVARARDAGVIISPRDVFDHKSVAALAESAHLEQDRPDVLAELPGSAVGTVPLSPVAQWMLDRSSGGLRGGGVKRFSQALLLTAPADLTQDLLVRGLQVLLDRHGMLRARLVESDRVMEVLPPGSISAEGLIHRVAVDSVDDEGFRALASGELEAVADSLDPATADMVRVIWFDLADKPDVSTGRGRLLVVIHHLVVDGVSWRILVTDLASVTAQLQAGVTPELPQIGTSFRRWAHGLVEHVGDRSVELDIWKTILDGDDPLIGSRPLDPTIDVDDTVDTVTVDISPSATRNLLTTVPAAFHAGVNDGLVTAVALASIEWRRRRGMDIAAALITLEGHGREEGAVHGADLARTVGWFTTLYPVRVELGAIDVDDALAGGADAGRALKAVKEYVRAIPDHGIGFGMLRYLSGESDPLGRFRSPQISFNYLGRISSSDGTQDWLPVEGNRRLGGTQNPSMPVASVIDINAAVEDHVDGPCLTASFTFPRGVLDRSDIAEFAELWRRALDGLTAHASRPDAGGLTPSDIPLVSVDQQQIERWENDFPGLHDVWSVSPLQAGLMFHASLAATSTDVYTAQLCVELEGSVDSERLRGAAAGLLANHPNLCAAFVYDVHGLPVQLIVDDAVIPWTEVDLSDRGSATDADLERRLAEDRSAPFDLASPPLLRLTLLRTSPTRCVLVVTNHHIVLDGWSMPLLVRELLMRYADDSLSVERAPADLPETPSYRTYLEWLMHRDMETSLAAWEDALEGVDEPTLLAPSTPIAEQLVPEEVAVDLPDSVRDGLGALVQRSGITMNTVIQAAWGVLLSRMLSRDDVVFGVTVSGRSPELPGVENMMGLLINTLPVRVQLDPDETCTQLLARLQSEQTALLDHHYVGLGAIQSVVGTGNLFDTLSVFESYPIDTSGMGGNTDIAGMRVTAVNARDATHYPLTVLSVAEPTLQVSLRYQPAAFDRAAVDTIAQRMSRILAAFAANADTPVGEVDVFVAGERGLVVGGWDGVGVVVGGLTLVDVLDGRFAGVGGGGLVCGGVVLSWGEFDVRVNRFARLLISLGVGPESRVCVALSRSVELLVAVFAVVRAGGVFVPVDVGAPVERVGFVVGVVDPVVVLSRVGDGGCLPVGVGFVDVGCVDVSGFSGGPVGGGDRLGVLLPEHAVYVMFTSGSTGRPKGVVVSHAGVVNRLLWMQGEFPLGVGDVVLQKTPVSFDVSVWELFWPLMVVARLVVADPGGHRDPVYLVGVIERWGVSVVHFVPSMLEVFVGELSVGELGVGCSGLRRVFVSGEGLSSVLAGRFAGVCGAELVNLYGPTEASVDVTFHRVEGVVGVGVPIGRPVWNTRVLVLDSRLRPVPVGVVGELYVGGVQVARGYEGRVDLTVGRFVADPVSGVVGARVYRTGDVVRWGCGGVLEFVGRTDFQVKVRGQRVELGEVEAVLAAQVGVAGAVVVLRSGVGGDFLVGFVVGEVGVVVDEVVVLEGVRRSLPGFMVPSVVVVWGSFR
ncbi:amino acid adenylation domain-containing protein [Rhodococcus qingshengii]